MQHLSRDLGLSGPRPQPKPSQRRAPGGEGDRPREYTDGVDTLARHRSRSRVPGANHLGKVEGISLTSVLLLREGAGSGDVGLAVFGRLAFFMRLNPARPSSSLGGRAQWPSSITAIHG